MATYLPDIAPYVPDIQTFTPDYGFLQKALSIKQQRYDSAYNHITSSLSSIQNSDLFTQESIAKREQYLKGATTELRKLREADLSLPENQAAAEKVFSPFWEDTGLVHELYTGKKINSELSYAEGLRSSKKAEDAGLYSEDSVRDIQNFKKEYAEATPEQRLTMSPRNYTKKVDVISDMNKQLKDLGISGTVKQSVDGSGYKFVNQNGKESVLPFYTFFKTNLSEDSRNYLTMKGRVQGRQAYENALALHYGDKEAALDAIGNELIENEVKSLTRTIIPELKNKEQYILNRMKSLTDVRKSQGSDLTQEDVENLQGLEQALTGIREQLKDPLDEAKSLVSVSDINDDGTIKEGAQLNMNSEAYKDRLALYRVNYGQAYGSQMIEGYANAWANTMASFTKEEIEDDKAWKNVMDVQQKQAELITKATIADENNETKENIAALKAGGKGKVGTTSATTGTEGTVYNGKNQPVYMGKDPQGIAQMTPAQSHQIVKTQIAQQLPMASVTLFDKIFPELGLSKGFYDKLIDNMQKGNLKGAAITVNDEEKKILDKAFSNGVLKSTGIKSYTNENVYKMILANMNDKINSDLEANPYKYRDMLTKIDTVKTLAAAYKDVEEVEKKFNNKILTDKSFVGYTRTNQDGNLELVPIEDLKKQRMAEYDATHIISPEGTIKVANADGTFKTVSGVNNRSNNQQQSGANRAFMMTKIYAEVDREYENKKKLFEEKFNSDPEIPKAKLRGNVDAFTMGNLVYTTMDNKDNLELAEVAVKQLLGDANLSDMSKTMWVASKDTPRILESGAMRDVLERIRDAATEIDGIGVTLHGYDDKFKKESYSINVPPDKLRDLFTKEELKTYAPQLAALNKIRITSDSPVGTSPANPGGIKNSYTMFESMVKEKPYQTDAFFDKAKIGGYNIRPLPGTDGFELRSWYYPYDPVTGKPSEEKKYDEEGTITIPYDANLEEVRSTAFQVILQRGRAEDNKAKANPPAPKGSGISIDQYRSELLKRNIKL